MHEIYRKPHINGSNSTIDQRYNLLRFYSLIKCFSENSTGSLKKFALFTYFMDFYHDLIHYSVLFVHFN